MVLLQRTLDGLLESGPYALMGLGLTLGFGLMRRVNLAHGAGAMLGAYLGSWLFVRLGWPVAGVLCMVVLATVVTGLYVQWMCFHHTDRLAPNAQRAVTTVGGVDAFEVVALVSSFAVWMQLEQLCVNLLPRHLNPFPDFAAAHEWVVGGLSMRPDRVWMDLGVVLLVLTLSWAMRTRMGLALRATADNALAAHVSGLPVRRLQRWGFAWAGALAGVAACAVLSLEGQVTPMFGMWVLMKGLTAAVIGGLGSLRGVLWGAVLLGVVEAHAQALLGPLGRDASTWVLLLTALVWHQRTRGSGQIPGRGVAYA